MREEIYTNLILKRLNGEISEADLQKLEEWLVESNEHQLKYNEVEKIWKLTGEGHEIINMDMSKEWSRFKNRIEDKEVKQEATIVKPMWSRNLMRIAAGVLFLVAAFGVFKMVNTENEFTTIYAKAEKQEIRLPDNSVVWLNKDSEITYRTAFAERKIQLKGEAYFDVQKKNGATFTIETGQTKTQVLGTTFNVRAYENEATEQVVVFTGKVSFDGLHDNEEGVILTSNEKGTYQKSNKKVSKDANENLNVLTWKNNKIRFEEESVGQIISTLEKVYNIKITTSNPGILKCQFTGTFEKTTTDEIIESLAFGLSLTTKKTNNSYEISGKGCE